MFSHMRLDEIKEEHLEEMVTETMFKLKNVRINNNKQNLLRQYEESSYQNQDRYYIKNILKSNTIATIRC